MARAILQGDDNATGQRLYVAFELSATKWKLVLGPGDKRHHEVTVDAGDLVGVEREVERARRRYGQGQEVAVVSCLEAGRDGFWIHRALVERGWSNLVIDAASMDVDRRARRVKTDRIDAERLLASLIRYTRGDEEVWSVVRVPSREDEDARRLHRERGRLKKERTSHVNRVRSLLALHGIRVMKVSSRVAKGLTKLRTPDGKALPPGVTAEIARVLERIALVQQHVNELEGARKRELEVAKSEAPTSTATTRKVATLTKLRGIGLNCAWLLGHELFGWRTFNNRREIAGAAGLTPTPYQSGSSDRQQGISKAGNPRVRTMLVEIAWCWLRYQPKSELSDWFRAKFGGGTGRMKRIGIVALARRLLIALWRFVEQGVVPKGALLKNEEVAS